MEISSVNNQRIKDTVKLKLKKYRKKFKKFIIESLFPIKYALDAAFDIEVLFICYELIKQKNSLSELLAQINDRNIEIVEVSKSVFNKMSYVKDTDGLLAVSKIKLPLSLNDIQPREGIYLILESIEQLSNLGGLIRIADNAGVVAVILCDERTDIYNPGVIRSSIGTVFTMPIISCSSAEAIIWCKESNISTLATTPHASLRYTDIDMKKSVGIVVGNEYNGLSDLWMNSADSQVLIPMYGKANSLSVTSSAAILLYEAVRQKRL